MIFKHKYKFWILEDSELLEKVESSCPPVLGHVVIYKTKSYKITSVQHDIDRDYVVCCVKCLE